MQLVPERGRRQRAVARARRGGTEVDLALERPLREGGRKDAPTHLEAIPEDYVSGSDPSLNFALQDLGDQIVWDLHEACDALDDPDLWYPGVDEGIEPVSDEHVALVTWASQRELYRELRYPRGALSGAPKRPAVELAELPWHIQRAFAERRRLRYLQWGITRAHWERGTWRLLDVPDDDWAPPWIADNAA